MIEPRLLSLLTRDRRTVIVSGTNGKTTTTRLLSTALATIGPVASNTTGANMTPGIVAALNGARPEAMAVLEVDERWVPAVLATTGASTVVLLNLSRDQLDRTQEVRALARRWRDALGDFTRDDPDDADLTVIASADDPLVVWAAQAAPAVRWVATAQDWIADAAGCPACAGRILFIGEDWHCSNCELRRPTPTTTIGADTITVQGRSIPIEPTLPGRVNRVNAAFALTAALSLGAVPDVAATAIESVHEVAGRYRVTELDGTPLRLLLAKNPAGWHEALGLLRPAPAPVVIAINARIADGHDPSWLWDVEFERLGGRTVIACGERRHDLAVRLLYAGVDHLVADGLDDALHMARDVRDPSSSMPIDVAGNYTAFQEFLARVGEVA